jgi:hypothetical protein
MFLVCANRLSRRQEERSWMPGLRLNFSITNAGYYEGVLFIRQGVNIPELAGGHRVVLNSQLNLARSIYPLILSVNKKHTNNKNEHRWKIRLY